MIESEEHAVQSYLEYSWVDFSYRLNQVLADLKEGEYLVLTTPEKRYVQFAGMGGGNVRIEATSNHYASNPVAILDEAGFQMMDRLGWQRPTHSPEQLEHGEYQKGGSPNFFVDVNSADELTTAAARAAATLRHVFKALWPGVLLYDGFAREGGKLRFPLLCIVPRERT